MLSGSDREPHGRGRITADGPRSRWWVAAFAGWILLSSGCTSSEDGGTGAPPNESSPPPQQLTFDPSARVTQDLWPRDTTKVPAARTKLPASIDPRDSIGSPSIVDAPLPAATAAVQLSLFSKDADTAGFAPGEVALVGPDGQWRSVPVHELGFRGTPNLEMPFDLSRDGKRLALSDDHAVVVLDVTTGSFDRWPVPAREALLFSWSSDRDRLLFTDRFASTSSPPGWELSLSDGQVEKVPFDAWRSTIGTDGSVVEIVRSRRTGTARFKVFEQGRARDSTPLSVPLGETERPYWHRDVAVLQRSRQVNDAPAAQGVAVFDTGTGDLTAFLPARAHLGWTEVNGWIDSDRLVVSNLADGHVFVWSPHHRTVEHVTEVETHGTNVAFAFDAL